MIACFQELASAVVCARAAAEDMAKFLSKFFSLEPRPGGPFRVSHCSDSRRPSGRKAVRTRTRTRTRMPKYIHIYIYIYCILLFTGFIELEDVAWARIVLSDYDESVEAPPCLSSSMSDTAKHFWICGDLLFFYSH